MTRCQTGCPHHMNIIFHCHASGLCGCLKHGTDIHIESKISKCRGNHLDSTIMAVLPHFGHQNSGPPPLFSFKVFGSLADRIYDLTVTVFGSIHAGYALGGRHKPTKYFFQSIGDFTHCRTGPHRRNTDLQQIATGFSSLDHSRQCLFDSLGVAVGFQCF